MDLTWPKEYTRFKSHAPNEQYRDGWDRIFGKKDKPEEDQQPEKEDPK